MKNILFIDSKPFYTSVLEEDSKKYLEGICESFKFFDTTNTIEALRIISKNKIDLIFIDILSKQYNPFEFIKSLDKFYNTPPVIVAVTSLIDDEYRYKALDIGVENFIFKPYDNKEIEELLNHLCNIHHQNQENEDDFFDFDEEEEFLDFDDNEEFLDFDDGNEQKELMEQYNQTHGKVSAQEFLLGYDNYDSNLEELEDLSEEMELLVAGLLFDDDPSAHIDDIIRVIGKYHRFLFLFSEFDELERVLEALIGLIETIDPQKLKNNTLVSKFIVAIIKDLNDWKEHVFMIKDAIDINYINASVLNSYIQLQTLLEKKN